MDGIDLFDKIFLAMKYNIVVGNAIRSLEAWTKHV